jgi:hypothetical protein
MSKPHFDRAVCEMMFPICLPCRQSRSAPCEYIAANWCISGRLCLMRQFTVKLGAKTGNYSHFSPKFQPLRSPINHRFVSPVVLLNKM